MTEKPSANPRQTIAKWLAAAWIAATAVYFYVRFTQTVYDSHKPEIDALLDRLF